MGSPAAIVLTMLLLAAAAQAGTFALPPEGACAAARLGAGREDTASGARPAPGTRIGLAQLDAARALFPPELFAWRERLFWDGMEIEVGPCFRDYAPPAWFRKITHRHAGRARLLDHGGLAGLVAGLPFPPDTLGDGPEDAARWAWNVDHRYRAAGSFADRFRHVRVDRGGQWAEANDGERFVAALAHRPDFAGRQDAVGLDKWIWVGVLRYRNHAHWGRGAACRMVRRVGADADPDRGDDHWIYSPSLRRVRRANIHHRRDIFLPYWGLGNRPHHYRWTVAGVRDLLAVINARDAFFPADPDRNFGPLGLSPARDRFELRRVLVLDGVAREPDKNAHAARVRIYADLQTLFPLYHVEWDASGELRQLTVRLGRWSEDRPDYPRWPDDPARPVRVVDLVGALRLERDGGHRFEMWEAVGTPPPDAELARRTSMASFGRP